MAYTVRLYYPEAASGTYELWEPNSSTRVTAYSDYDATASIAVASQTLSSVGRAKFFVKQLVEVVVKSSAGVEIDRFVEGARAELIEVVNAGLTGVLSNGSQGAGGTTNLNTMVTSALSTFGGVDLKYLEVTGGNARLIRDVIAERFVSIFDVKGSNNEVAKGDGTADDYVALQKLLDRLAAKGGGVGLIPKGTFACSTGLTTSTANVWLAGVGPTASKIKNTGAAITLLTVNVTGESNCVISDLTLTHATTSSGSALSVTAGNGLVCRGVVTELHRFGLNWATTAERGEAQYCRVASTDGDSTSRGITLGKHGQADHCIAAAATGTAFKLGAAYAETYRCVVNSSTATGFHFAAADTVARHCFADACTTGFSVGAFARAGCRDCKVGTNTTDLLTDASATAVLDEGNLFPTRTLNELGGTWWIQPRQPVWKRNRSTDTAWTPDPKLGALQVLVTGADSTIAATATTDLNDGQMMIIVLQNTDTGAHNYTFNAQYDPGYALAVAANSVRSLVFFWRASSSKWLAAGCFADFGGDVW